MCMVRLILPGFRSASADTSRFVPVVPGAVLSLKKEADLFQQRFGAGFKWTRVNSFSVDVS